MIQTFLFYAVLVTDSVFISTGIFEISESRHINWSILSNLLVPRLRCFHIFYHFPSILLRYDKYRRKNINALRANPTKWSNTLKQFVGTEPSNSWRTILKIVYEKHFPCKIFIDQLIFSKIWSKLSFSCTIRFFHTFIIRQYVKGSYLNCKIAPLTSYCVTHWYALLFVIPYVYVKN